MTLVLSPHLDDAVLGLGQWLFTEPSVTVITVFAGIPADGTFTDYDRARGFKSSADAMCARRAEDADALDRLGCTPLWLDLLDRQYDPGPQDVQRALRPFVGLPREHTYAPLGVGHPDHVMLAQAARNLVPPGGELLCYEDLPARVLGPELVVAALNQICHEGFDIDPLPVPLAAGLLDIKREAIGKYASQFPDGADNPAYLVPERVWRATRPKEGP